MNSRFNNVDKHLNNVENRLDNMDENMTRMEKRMDSFDNKLDRISNQVHTNTQKIDHMLENNIFVKKWDLEEFAKVNELALAT